MLRKLLLLAMFCLGFQLYSLDIGVQFRASVLDNREPGYYQFVELKADQAWRLTGDLYLNTNLQVGLEFGYVSFIPEIGISYLQDHFEYSLNADAGFMINPYLSYLIVGANASAKYYLFDPSESFNPYISLGVEYLAGFDETTWNADVHMLNIPVSIGIRL